MLPHALVPPADPEGDGVVVEHGEDREYGAEPARLPLAAVRAREMTTGLREAAVDVRRSVAVLAARVRDAHDARVWQPLGHASWESYCQAEFGIRRAQEYREASRNAAQDRAGSWTSLAPWPRPTAPSRPTPIRLARETAPRPPRHARLRPVPAP